LDFYRVHQISLAQGEDIPFIMNCIFCQRTIDDTSFFCEHCERDRLMNSPALAPELSREGQMLSKIVRQKYELLGQIFRDSLDIEFKGVYISKGRTDCIHTLPVTLARNPVSIQNYHAKVSQWSKLKVRNFLRPVGSGKQGKINFCINLFPSGLRLSQILIENIDIPFIWGLRLLHSLCIHLKAAHAHNLVHANLKPTSLFVNSTGTLQITNIGLLDPYPEEIFEDKLPGDISLYSSPEQLMKGTATVHSDIYSFALIAYRLLTGLHPFEAEKEVNILYKNLHESVIPALALNHSIPAELNDIIMRNLNKKPDLRSDSIDDMLNVLNTYLKEEINHRLAPEEELAVNAPASKVEQHAFLIDQGKTEYFDKNYAKAIEYWNDFLTYDRSNFAVQKYIFFAEQRLEKNRKNSTQNERNS